MYNLLNESSTNESDSSIRNLFVILSYFETASQYSDSINCFILIFYFFIFFVNEYHCFVEQ